MLYIEIYFGDIFAKMIFLTIFAPPNRGIYLICIGESVAQQVEHNTFNVGVPGSSPGGFTKINEQQITSAAFFCIYIVAMSNSKFLRIV